MTGNQGDLFGELPVGDDVVDTTALDGPAALQRLKQWTEAGWLRRLDTAFARFIAERAPDASAAVLFSAALVAHMEGRGHTCLRIDEWLAAPAELLAWPADGLVDLQAALSQLPTHAPAWLQALADCSAVRADAADERQQPLILEGSRLYLRRYWRYEGDVAAQVLQRGALHDPVDEPATRLWLDRLFGDHASSATPDWQRIACAVALRGRLSIITGGPGTGKTYTAARLLALLFASSPHPERLRVALAAPTGKAAARLKQSIDTALEELQGRLGDALPLRELASHMGAARTLHSLLGARADTRKFRHDAAHPLDVDVLLVDEASMVHLEMMAALLAALPPQARVVFLGDKDQLASVEAGAVLADLCRDAERGRYTESTRSYVRAVTGQMLPDAFVDAGSPLAQQTVMLRESRRFGGPIGQLALAVNAGQARTAAALLHEGEADVLRWLPAAQPAAVVRLA
ncbi:MAG: exodeoxyribonuclease alpha subunit, partial [Rhizobacter sp.]|nr:exodeoxyribonuclease alpha subunit [Rhizobacter sp.]